MKSEMNSRNEDVFKAHEIERTESKKVWLHSSIAV